MKFILITSFLVFASVAHAGTLILGEWTGTGTQVVTNAIEGQTSSYDSTCNVAINIESTATSFGVPFAVFTCNVPDRWNESWVVHRAGSELFVNGQVVGSITSKAAKLSLRSERSVEIIQSDFGDGCSPTGTSKEKATLHKVSSWKFTFESATAVFMERSVETDALTDIYYKPPYCDKAYIKTVPSKRTELLGLRLVRNAQ